MKGAKSEAEINSHLLSSYQSANQRFDRRQTPTYTDLTLVEFMDKFFNNIVLAEENETQGCHSTDWRQTSIYLHTFDELIDEFYSNKLLVEINETQDCHSVTGIVKGEKSEAEINSHLPSHTLNELMEEFFHCTLLAEENETQGIPPTPLMSSPAPFPMQEISLPIIQADGIILNDQPSLPRQGYLNIPGTTIKGVPQSYDYMLPPPQQQQQPLGLNQNCDHLNSGPNFPPILGMATGGCNNIVAANHKLQGTMEENRGGNPQTPPGNGNGNGGGYMVRPGWSGGMCNNKVDGISLQEISLPIIQADGIILNDQPSLPRQGYLNIPGPTIKRVPQSYDYMLPPPQQQQQPLGLNQNCDHLNSGPNFPPILGMATGGCDNIVAANHELQGGMEENRGGNPQTPPGNGNGGGYMVRPGWSGGMCNNKVDGISLQEISLPIIQADGIILNDQPSLPRQGYLNIPGPTIKRVPQSYDYMLPLPQQQQQPLGLNQNCDHLNSGPNFPPILGMATGGCDNIVAANHELQGGMEENRGGNPQTPPGNGNGGGYIVSPGWSGGMCNNKVDGISLQEISLPIIQADGIILNDQPSLPRQGYLNIPGPTIKRVPQSYDYMLPPPQQQQQPLGLNQNCGHLNSGPNSLPILGIATGGCVNIVAANHELQGGMEENRGGNPQTPSGNGNGGGYMVSPGWSGRMCNNKVDGRKSNRGRNMVDRTPKIMSTNRESSARNKESKQACAYEFKEEVIFLVEENKRLKQALAESEGKNNNCSTMRKRHREQNANMGTKSQKVDGKLKMQYDILSFSEATLIQSNRIFGNEKQ